MLPYGRLARMLCLALIVPGFVLIVPGFVRAGDGDAGGGSLFSLALPSPDLSVAAAYRSSSADAFSTLAGAGVLGEADSTDGFTKVFGFKAGLGFTADPGTFLMGFQGDFFITPNFTLGPLIQLGVSDNNFLFAPTLNLGAMFDLPMDGFERFKPILHMGLGLAYLDWDGAHGHHSEARFLINFGLGFEYFITDYFALGTDLIFNVLPVELDDTHFFVAWQIVTVRFQF